MTDPALYRYSFQAMAALNECQLYADSRARADAISAAIIQEIRRIETKFSRYQSSSIISEINKRAGTLEKFEVDEETAALLDYADTAYTQSAELFDITTGVLRRAWNFKDKALPDSDRVAALRPLIGWNQVEWNRPYIRLPKTGMEIDFGGIGKEYAVDRAIVIAAEYSAISAMINLAGDLRVSGPHVDGRPWHVGIKHPRETGKVQRSLAISSGALATSGDYERCIVVDGIRYSHILNPRTGMPVRGFQSVSVLAESCLVAGTAATTAMLLADDGGEQYLRELGVHYLAISDRGIVTGSFDDAG